MNTIKIKKILAAVFVFGFIGLAVTPVVFAEDEKKTTVPYENLKLAVTNANSGNMDALEKILSEYPPNTPITEERITIAQYIDFWGNGKTKNFFDNHSLTKATEKKIKQNPQKAKKFINSVIKPFKWILGSDSNPKVTKTTSDANKVKPVVPTPAASSGDVSTPASEGTKTKVVNNIIPDLTLFPTDTPKVSYVLLPTADSGSSTGKTAATATATGTVTPTAGTSSGSAPGTSSGSAPGTSSGSAPGTSSGSAPGTSSGSGSTPTTPTPATVVSTSVTKSTSVSPKTVAAKAIKKWDRFYDTEYNQVEGRDSIQLFVRTEDLDIIENPKVKAKVKAELQKLVDGDPSFNFGIIAKNLDLKNTKFLLHTHGEKGEKLYEGVGDILKLASRFTPNEDIYDSLSRAKINNKEVFTDREISNAESNAVKHNPILADNIHYRKLKDTIASKQREYRKISETLNSHSDLTTYTQNNGDEDDVVIAPGMAPPGMDPKIEIARSQLKEKQAELGTELRELWNRANKSPVVEYKKSQQKIAENLNQYKQIAKSLEKQDTLVDRIKYAKDYNKDKGEEVEAVFTDEINSIRQTMKNYTADMNTTEARIANEIYNADEKYKAGLLAKLPADMQERVRTLNKRRDSWLEKGKAIASALAGRLKKEPENSSGKGLFFSQLQKSAPVMPGLQKAAKKIADELTAKLKQTVNPETQLAELEKNRKATQAMENNLKKTWVAQQEFDDFKNGPAYVSSDYYAYKKAELEKEINGEVKQAPLTAGNHSIIGHARTVYPGGWPVGTSSADTGTAKGNTKKAVPAVSPKTMTPVIDGGEPIPVIVPKPTPATDSASAIIQAGNVDMFVDSVIIMLKGKKSYKEKCDGLKAKLNKIDAGKKAAIISNAKNIVFHASAVYGALEILKDKFPKLESIITNQVELNKKLNKVSLSADLKEAKTALDNGANVNGIIYDLKDFPLFCVTDMEKTNIKIVEFLLENGADINKVDKNRFSPLYLAVIWNNLEIVKFLVQKGADVNITNYFDRTPLHTAALSGHFEIAKFLVQKGADVNIKDPQGKTPSQLASEKGYNELADYLKKFE